jgi:hypothetical protein
LPDLEKGKEIFDGLLLAAVMGNINGRKRCRNLFIAVLMNSVSKVHPPPFTKYRAKINMQDCYLPQL